MASMIHTSHTQRKVWIVRNSKGQFIKVTYTKLRDGNKGRRARGTSLNRQQVRGKKPKGYHLSDCPRAL